MQIILAIIIIIIVSLLLVEITIEVAKVIVGPLIGIIGLLFIYSAYDLFKRKDSWVYKWGIYKFSYLEVIKLLAVGSVLIGLFILWLYA